MVDYKNTKIYYIQVGDKRYYGHTAQKYLCQREHKHRTDFKTRPQRRLYAEMRNCGMTEKDIKCVWVENFPCESVNEAKAREQFWINIGGNLNVANPNGTRKEWVEKNSHKIKDRQHSWYMENRGRILKKAKQNYDREKKREYDQRHQGERVFCDICGKEMRRDSMSKHKKALHTNL